MVRHRLVAVPVTLVLMLAACGDDAGDDASSTTTTVATPTTSIPTATTGTVPATGTEVLVFLARDDEVAASSRVVTPPAVAEGAIEALLAGPTEADVAAGLSSGIPTNTRLIRISVEAGLATVDLSGDLINSGQPTALPVAQIVYTLTQFPTVDRVSIQIESTPVQRIGTDGTPVVEITRSDVEDEVPAIVVESPTPGEEVTSPVRVTGSANTFEATVAYEVTAADGTVLDDGFTTATSGTGTRGTFDLTTGDLPAGPAVLTLFQESGQDGSRIDLYEVSVTVV